MNLNTLNNNKPDPKEDVNTSHGIPPNEKSPATGEDSVKEEPATEAEPENS